MRSGRVRMTTTRTPSETWPVARGTPLRIRAKGAGNVILAVRISWGSWAAPLDRFRFVEVGEVGHAETIRGRTPARHFLKTAGLARRSVFRQTVRQWLV